MEKPDEGGAPEAAAAPQPFVVPMDPLAMLMQRRWQMECETSLLLAHEIRMRSAERQDLERQLKELREENQHQAALIESLERKLLRRHPTAAYEADDAEAAGQEEQDNADQT